MKKRALPKTTPLSAIDTSSAAASPASPSSSSSTSSSSSCVVNVNDNHKKVEKHEEEEEEEKPIIPTKPKRVRRKKSINVNDMGNNNNNEKCPNNPNPPTTNRRSSIYRGVTRHRWTGRFEAHLWDKSSWNSIQNKKGRQVYLGAYDSEVDAARTYDLAALKYWGPETTLNFPLENYTKEYEDMQNVSKEEYLASLRRRSSGFSRGVSKYRGVARHHHNGRWEARIGRVFGNKYLYLGTFSSQEEAAAAYDLAAIEYRGANAVTNFDISNYIGRVKNLVPKGESQAQSPDETKAMQPQLQKKQQHQGPSPKRKSQRQQVQQIKQQIEEEQEDQEMKPQDLQQVHQEEQTQTPSEFAESKLISSIDQSSMLVMDGPEDDRENPWSFCLDAGGYDPLLVPDIPLEEDGKLLDLFDQTGFEDDIDLIFEGEGNLISMDTTYFDGMDTIGCQTRIKNSEVLDKKIEISPKLENSVCCSLSSPLSSASTTSLVSCQL